MIFYCIEQWMPVSDCVVLLLLLLSKALVMSWIMTAVFDKMFITDVLLLCHWYKVVAAVSVFVTVKHLWDEKPTDWPAHIPFKDPNNAVKDGKYYFTCFVCCLLNKLVKWFCRYMQRLESLTKGILWQKLHLLASYVAVSSSDSQ